MQVVDTTAQDKIFALLYGGSGTGKTHFIGTLGELGTVLVIDADSGYKTIIYGQGITDKMRENIVIVTFDAFSDLDQLADLVYKNDPVLWTKVLSKKNPDFKVEKPFDWICYDTWTEMQWTMMQELRKKEGLLGSGLNFRKNIGIQHWGMLTDLNKMAIEQLKECSKATHGDRAVNQVFVFQEKVDKNEDLNTIERGPAIHGKMVKEVPAYFDEMIHTSVSATGEYQAATKPKLGWPAKTRIKVPQEYKNPTAKMLFT